MRRRGAADGRAAGGAVVAGSTLVSKPQRHLHPLRALTARDHRLLIHELHIRTTARQLAVIRTIADEFERSVRNGSPGAALREQLVEELARLGCRSLEAAAEMTKLDAGEEGGIRLAGGNEA